MIRIDSTARILAFALISVLRLSAEQFDLKIPAGVIHVESTITVDGNGHPHWVATATNVSNLPIQSAKICFTSPSYRKNCLFWMENPDQREWAAGETLTAELSSKVKIAGPTHFASLSKILQAVAPEPSRFAGITRIYVEQIDGSYGPMARQQLMAGIANTQRFQAVDTPELADAVVRGMYNVEVDATRTESNRKGGVVALGSATAAESTGLASGVGFATGKSTSITEQVKSQTATFRLVTPQGIILWGWDDSKPCTTQRTKCAVDDLVSSASR